MRIEPIKQIEQLTYRVKTNDASKLPPQFAPDDGGCIKNDISKDVTKSGENIDIII